MKRAASGIPTLYVALIAVALSSGCASYGGRGLQPGEATEADVLRVMGTPAMRWENPDHSKQLAFPRGPAGYHTFMVHLGPDGRLQRIENVMSEAAFGRVRAGMSEDEVTRVLGPSVPAWSAYFKARRELVWEWRYCDDWNSAARFDVLFDADSGKVRTTQSHREECRHGPCECSR